MLTESNFGKLSTDFRSQKSLKREQKRNSPQICEFRAQVEAFLKETEAPDNLAYYLRQDLSKMTSMEYYGVPNKGLRTRILEPKEVIYLYCELLIRHNSPVFSRRLIRKISVHQNQSIRRLFSKNKVQRGREARIGKSKGIWEHPIPIRYVCSVLIDFVNQKDLRNIDRFLNRMSSVGQVFLTHEQNNRVHTLYPDSMPEGWIWDSPVCDTRIRHLLAGLKDED